MLKVIFTSICNSKPSLAYSSFLLFTLSLFNYSSSAQNKHIPYQTIKIIAPLATNTTCINTTYYDNNGYLWLGTQAGIYRFDGQYTKNIPLNPKKTGIRIHKVFPYNGEIAFSSLNTYSHIPNGKISSDTFQIKPKFILKHPGSDVIHYSYDINSGSLIYHKNVYNYNGWLAGYILTENKFILFDANYTHIYSNNKLFRVLPFRNRDNFNLIIRSKKIVTIKESNRTICEIDTLGNIREYSFPQITDNSKLSIVKNNDSLFFIRNGVSVYLAYIANNKLNTRFLTNLSDINAQLNIVDVAMIDSNNFLSLLEVNGLFNIKRSFFEESPPYKKNPAHYELFTLPDGKSVLSKHPNIVYNANNILPAPTINDMHLRYCIKSKNGGHWLVYESDSISQIYYTQRNNTKYITKVHSPITEILETSDNGLTLFNFDSVYTINDKHIIKYSLTDSTGYTINFNTAVEYGNGSMLAGCITGLFIVNPGKSISPIDFFNNVEVRHITRLKDKYWILTYGKGIYIIDKGKINHLPTDKFNYIQFAHQIIPDNNGRLWIPTNNGLVVTTIDACNKYLEDHTKTPGYFYFNGNTYFSNNEFNSSSHIAKLDDGRYALPNMAGVVYFNPDIIPTDFPKNKLQIDEVTANGKAIQIANNALPPYIHTMAFKISLPYWDNNENKNIQYCISSTQNEDDELWQDLKDYQLVIPNISYGNYKLRIRVRTGFGASDFSETSYAFSIAPPWYKTNIFKDILAVLLLLLAILGIRIRTQRLVAKAKNLQKQIDLATTDLKQVNTSLEQHLHLRDKLLSIISHDILGALHALSHTLHYIEDDTSISPFYREVMKELAGSADQLAIFAENIVTWIKYRQNGMGIETELQRVSLGHLIDEKWPLLRSRALLKNVKLVSAIPEEYDLNTDPKLLGIAIYNIIGNALKFTENGSITINAYRTDKHIITIADTGTGFPDTIIDAYNNDGYLQASKDGTLHEKGNGIGLIIIKELIQILNGETYISNTEAGACFTIILPTNEA